MYSDTNDLSCGSEEHRLAGLILMLVNSQAPDHYYCLQQCPQVTFKIKQILFWTLKFQVNLGRVYVGIEMQVLKLYSNWVTECGIFGFTFHTCEYRKTSAH